MKKTLALFLVLVAFTPRALATDITNFDQSRIQSFATLTLTAQNDTDITTSKGIGLIIPTGTTLLWEQTSEGVLFGGTAAGKIVSPYAPIFSADGYRVTIPVKEDFKSGEVLTIDGLKVRSYKTEVSSRALGLDVNGDGIGDRDIHSFSVRTITQNDFIPPYSPTNFTATYKSDTQKVELTWNNPPDYDFNQINLYRDLTRPGKASGEQYLTSGQLLSYSDSDVQKGDVAKYILYAADNNGNLSSKIEKTVTISDVSTPSAPTTPTTPTLSTEEQALLQSRYAGYKLRYQIKCTPSGRTVAEGDSACLWAKIDFLYAKMHLGRTDISASFTAREIELITKRLVYSEGRYHLQCKAASTPAETCTTLGRAIERAHYFIENF